MNRFRNLIAGFQDDGGGGGGGGDQTGRPGEGAGGSRSRGGALGPPPPRSSRYGRRDPGDDDLYLSDDDDWGMSAFSSSADGGGGIIGGRRSSSAFWDQKSASAGTEGAGVDGSGRGLQWEREAIARDGADGNFEIGDDDFYHSETRRAKVAAQDTGYDEGEGQEDDEEEGGDDGGDDDASASSKQEQVVTAYRDYLKSIRDGGFESYLDTNDGMAAGGGDDGSDDDGRGVDDEVEALDRALDAEEERANGSLYGDLYGVRNVQAEATPPYEAWRAKAKVLLQQEQERELRDAASPARQMLANFRRKRSNEHLRNSWNSWQQRRSGVYDEENREAKLYSYRSTVVENPKFRMSIIGVCLLLALVAGLSYYEKEGGDKDEQDNPLDLFIPSESNDTSVLEADTKNKPHPPPTDAIINSLHTFDPQWYDRRSGWEGITYINAVNFCLSKEKRVPCPYEIYCTEGTDGPPYRGTRPNGEQWAAVSNGPNQFVQVGTLFACKRYTDLHDGKKPGWGITGVSEEHEHGAGGITQNVLCCVDVHGLGLLDPFTQWGEHGEMNRVEGDTAQKITNTAVVDLEDTEDEKVAVDGTDATPSLYVDDVDAQKREKAVIAAFQPIWFSSAHGWAGTSYEESIHFCESYNHMVLCPYAAYCPLGRGRPALPGSMVTDLDGEEWVPANGPMNTWVQIGTIDGDEESRCTLHHELLGMRPQWGIDGTRKEVKHHVMCCLM
ncbi:hypothetical protein ACHAWF_015684 [Thalassiosira exigua]